MTDRDGSLGLRAVAAGPLPAPPDGGSNHELPPGKWGDHPTYQAVAAGGHAAHIASGLIDLLDVLPLGETYRHDRINAVAEDLAAGRVTFEKNHASSGRRHRHLGRLDP